MGSSKQILDIGQVVWILRTGLPVQKCKITSIMSSTDTITNEESRSVTVEWEDDCGATVNKTVAENDVLPCPQEPNRSQAPYNRSHYLDNDNITLGSLDPNHNEQPPSSPQTTVLGDQGNCRKVCPTCSQSFKNERGLKTHITKKHATIADKLKINKIFKREEANKTHVESSGGQPQLKKEIDRWTKVFKEILDCKEPVSDEDLDHKMSDFLSFLRDANNTLPGPKHPAIRFYKTRKKNDLEMKSKGTRQSSNPQRANSAARHRRREQYQYEVAQYQYYNRRKKVVQSVMNADAPNVCPLSINALESHFKSVLETENNNIRNSYETTPDQPNVGSIDLKVVHRAIKSTSLDTSPGPDGVLIRTVKSLNISLILKYITEIILKLSYIPQPLRNGRTILIYKGKGEINEVSSWRPITIFSIVRRLIEKILDAELRKQLSFHRSQRGFVRGLPGCHVNTRIIDAILKKAKNEKSSASIAFLDITAAFDNVGHLHISRALKARKISNDLKNAVEALLTKNSITINVGTKKTSPISIRRGVPQGGPLSPTLFNIAIDHLYKEICDPQFANKHGYNLHDSLDNVVLTGFADDQAVTSQNIEAAERVTNSVQRIFREIGLSINAKKSTAILIEEGKLVDKKLKLDNGEEIRAIAEGEKIRYLGCSFSGELLFNEAAVDKLTENLNKLSVSNLLKPDQKLNIINQYVFPALTYPLQSAPLTKLNTSILEGIDIIIRRNVKSMLGLPASSSSAMLYAPRRLRGLGILNCQWEAPLQHWSLAQKLAKVPDAHFQTIFDFETEVFDCSSRLALDVVNVDRNFDVRAVRQSLREKAFLEWSRCKWQGQGVCHFKDYPKGNSLIYDKKSLSESEWVNMVKLNINYAPLKAVPGVSSQLQGESGPLCRKCGREPETPAHVLGKCPANSLLVTRRHHNVKNQIADLLKRKNYTCFDEVHCIDTDGTTRFADIVAFHNENDTALIVDPTVRFESNDLDQANKVDMEKKNIYEKCVPFLKEKFHEKYGDKKYEVRGLWFGARGTVPLKTVKFFKEFGLAEDQLAQIAENIVIDSLGILHNHLYS